MAVHCITNARNGVDNLHSDIKFLQLNLQHSRVATDNLEKLTAEHGTDILLLQEPYTLKNKIVGISKRHKIFTHGGHRPRAAIVITNNQIDTILLTQLSDSDTVVLEVTLDNAKKIILASMYLDINQQLTDDTLKIEAILQHAKGAGIILAMDSNSRSTSWHDKQTNARGRILEDFLTSNYLHILNEDSDYPTFSGARGSSNIDLSIVNTQLLRTMYGWEIWDQDSCSDHNIIRFTLGHDCHDKITPRNQEPRYIVQRRNINIFHKTLTQLVTARACKTHSQVDTGDLDSTLAKTVRSGGDIEKTVDDFYEDLTTACIESFKKQQTNKKATTHRSVPWWTEELTIMRKRLNALRRRFQRTTNNEVLRSHRKTQYLEGKARYASTIKNAKLRSWKAYCDLTPASNPWNVVYKLATGKRKANVNLSTLKKTDGSRTKDTADTLQYMLEHFISEDDNKNDDEDHRHARLQSQLPTGTADDKEFTVLEIRNAIESLGNKKAPGEDGITGEIFKSAFEIFPSYITAIYNGCLNRGVFPTRWKRSKLFPITKPGKDNCEDVTKFRPISLINTGGKVLEKVLISRINHYVFSHDYMNSNQFGFTPQKSTTDAIMAVKNVITEGLEAGDVFVLVSLDVKGAFDSAWWPAILNGLRAYECPNNLYKLARSYFTQRSASLSTNNYRFQKEVSKGCPQGSCCGPGFWNIQYNTILNLNFTRRTTAIAFADDLLLITRGESVREAENFANIEISKINLWSKSNKIDFNEAKSKTMLISRRKRKETKEIKIFLNNKPIEQVTTMKYLGVIIDEKLKFSQHISYAADKCAKLIFSLSKSAKIHWGLKHEALTTIYKGAILPLLLYGAPVWIEALRYDFNRRKYTRVQRLMNLLIAKAYRTTSSEALCILAGTTPITIKAEEAAKRYDVWKGHRSNTQKIDREVKLNRWPHPAEFENIVETDGSNDHTIQVYTDGSKGERGVGAGVAIIARNEPIARYKFKLDHRCSNNQAEQLAILKALDLINHIGTADNDPRTIGVYTDSRITIDSLKDASNHNYLIEKIRKILTNLRRDNWRTEFSWIKAHAGNPGNELADRLAKDAASNKNIPVVFDRIPKTTIYNELEEETLQKWQEEWERCNKAAVTKQFFPSVRDRIHRRIKINPNFTALVTGHGKTQSYLHRFKIKETATCPCNMEDETLHHILYNCTRHNKQRDLLKVEILKTGSWPVTYEKLASAHLKPFLTFTKTIDL